MKRITLIFSILATVFNFSLAQNPEFQNTLKSLVDSVQAKKWGADLTDYANQLERIAWAETKEWLPYYWAAYCYVNKSYSEKESGKRDLYLGHAESLIGVAEKIAPENDEIEVMKASIASARLAVSPSIRWLTYGNTSSKALKKAQKINPANPRAKLLEAQGIYYKPEAFGGGKAKAKPLINDALDKFAKFKPSSAMMPNWGEQTAKYMLREASK